MTQKKYLKLLLIINLLCLSVGGWFLHYRIHPITDENAYYIPFVLGILSTLLITILFFLKKGVPYAYILNGMTVIIGTITMSHYSLQNFSGPITISGIFFDTLMAEIIILWAKFFIGKVIFDLEITNVNNWETPRHKGRFLRYPNIGFWLVHLVAMSFFYYLGHILWK